MGRAIRPTKDGAVNGLRQLSADVDTLKRMPSGKNSVGIAFLKPATKAGAPSDADYTAATMPPVGSIVIDTTGSRLYVRVAVGSWKSVLLS